MTILAIIGLIVLALVIGVLVYFGIGFLWLIINWPRH